MRVYLEKNWSPGSAQGVEWRTFKALSLFPALKLNLKPIPR